MWQHAVEHWRDYAVFAGLVATLISLITCLVVVAIKATKIK